MKKLNKYIATYRSFEGVKRTVTIKAKDKVEARVVAEREKPRDWAVWDIAKL